MAGILWRPAIFFVPTITLRTLALTLLAALGVMQVLLWAFLGLGAGWIIGGALGLAALLWGLVRAPGWRGAVPWSALGVGWAVALVLLVLGGEGGWFFAPTDWQVRYAVLRDLTLNPWPFALEHPQGPLILRSPLGMYLAPALIGARLGGFHAACLALLVQNTLLLGVILALGAGLFATARGRWIGLGVFWAFSGMDVLGQIIARKPLHLHLEAWASMQFSSHVMQVLWAPQHAMAGWIFAVLYLLWRVDKVPLRVVLAALPLLALYSPLALIGCVPFAAQAGVEALLRRAWRIGDMLWPGLAGIIALPSLLYLAASSGAVGGGVAHTYYLSGYPLFILIELGGYLLALWALRRDQPFGLGTTLITVGVLLAVPFGQIGDGVDFVMRASIPALAVMAVMMGRILADPASDPARCEARRWVLIMGAIGLVTPASELWRGLTWPASPEVTCGYLGVIPKGYATYTTRLDALPKLIRPAHPALVPLAPPHPCWAVPWPDPLTGRATLTHPY